MDQITPGISPLQQLMGLTMQRAQMRAENMPTPEQREQALQSHMAALRAPADSRNTLDRLLAGYGLSENIADPRKSFRAMMGHSEASKEAQRNLAHKGEIAATRAEYDDMLERLKGAELGSGSMTAMMSAALNPIQNIGGVGINRLTGQAVVPKALEGIYSKIYQDAFKAAVEQKMPNPEEYARQQAETVIQQQILSNPSIAGSLYAQRPGQTPMPAQLGQRAATPGITPPEARAEIVPEGGASRAQSAEQWVSRLRREEEIAAAAGDFERAAEVSKARRAIESSAPAPGARPESLQYRDKPKSVMEESQAGEAGKRLQKEAETLNAAASASSELKMQLGQLQELFKTPDLPEGVFGERLQTIRSGLGSLGMLDENQMKTVGAGDLINAIGGKLSLLTRTADGSNLMPGAMSDFEQKILRSLAPGLGQTAEGRAALADFLSDMANVRIRMGNEANRMTDERGLVSPEWFKRKERILKEEQAQMALKARELKNRFGAK